jgi:hypothetical protein
VRLLDRIARRYGCLPHQVEALEPYALTMAAICVYQAEADAAEDVRKFPRAENVFIIGSARG